MYREKIKENSLVVVNGKEYIIQSLIGRGGCSLVYQAIEKENALHPWILKEFFPQNQLAYRESMKDSVGYGKVCCDEGQERAYSRLRNSFFHQEVILGNVIKSESFQVYSFDSIDEENGFAVMRPFSKDTVSLLELVKLWETNPPVSQDPYYSAMGRVSYALHIAEALLVLIEKMHKEGILHLDLSYNNVAWAGLDREARGVHSNVFLLDFGCAVKLNDGRHYKENPLDYSCSVGFSAPEVSDPMINELDCRADLYSVSALLFFLCTGKDAVTNLQWKMMDRLWQNSKWIRNGVKKLDIPAEIKEALCDILIKGCAKEPADRYCNAGAMLEKIHGLKVLAENYQSKHLLCRPVRPISQGFIPRTRELMEEIDTSLRNHKICVLCGMSGVGKSETARQYAQYSTSLTYEILLPEMITGQHYDWEKEIEKLRISGDEDQVDKELLLQEFLNKESSLLILHNFNTVDACLLQELMDTNASVIITTQCAPHEFERCNDFLAEVCIDIGCPNQEFLRSVFLAQFKTKRELVAEQMESVDMIIRGLFFNTMLIHTTALQLSEHPNRDMVTELAKELTQSLSLAETYKDTPGIVYEKDYSFSSECGEEEQTPFDVAMVVVAKILPKLTEMQRQVLQLLSVCPGEWYTIADVCMYLGDDINSRRGRVYPEIRKLQKRHLLETHFTKEEEEISLHPMMQQLMCCKVEEKEQYLELPSLDFMRHVERNIVTSYFDIKKRQYVGDASPRNDGDYFLSMKDGWMIHAMRSSAITRKMMEENEGHVRKIGQHGYVEIDVPNDELEFKVVHIYNENGIIILVSDDDTEYPLDVNGNCRRRFRIAYDAEHQLKHRYFTGPYQYENKLVNEDGKYINTYGYSCSVYIKCYLKNERDQVEIPSTFGGIPIHYIDYRDFIHDSSYTGLNNHRKNLLYDLVLSGTVTVFEGWGIRAKRLFINEGLHTLNIPGNYIEELEVPASLISLSDHSITPFMKKIAINCENEGYIDIDGFIYTKDRKKLLFMPPDKKRMSVTVDPGVLEINIVGLGYRKEAFLLERQSIAMMERFVARNFEFSDLERIIYTSINKCSMEQIKKTTMEFLENYREYEKKSPMPYYYKYYMRSGLFSQENRSKTVDCNSDLENIVLTEEWMIEFEINNARNLKIEGGIVQHLNPVNMERIYDLLLVEGLYGFPWGVEYSFDLLLVDYEILKNAINMIKEFNSYQTLHEMILVNAERDIMNELYELCGIL